MGCVIPHRRLGWLSWESPVQPICNPFGDGSCVAAATDASLIPNVSVCGTPEYLVAASAGSIGIDDTSSFHITDVLNVEIASPTSASVAFWLYVTYNGSGCTVLRTSDYTAIISLVSGISYMQNSGSWATLWPFPLLDRWIFIGCSFSTNLVYAAGADGKNVVNDLLSVSDTVFKEFYNGCEDEFYIDRIRVFNRALTETEFDLLFAEYSDTL